MQKNGNETVPMEQQTMYQKEIKDDFYVMVALLSVLHSLLEIVCIWLLAQNDNWAVIYD